MRHAQRHQPVRRTRGSSTGLAALLGLMPLTALVGCGSDRSPAADTSDAEVHTPPALAEASIGPDGGVLATGDGAFRLLVPAGAVSAPVMLRVRVAEAVAIGEGVTPRSPIYVLEPPGQTFAAPVTVRLAVLPEWGTPTELRIGWSLPGGGGFQELPTHLALEGDPEVGPGRLYAEASSMHFSYVFIADPNVPNTNAWFCCWPKDETLHTASDCITLGANGPTNCDTTICDLTASGCPQPANVSTGCCGPIDPNDDHPFGCANMPDFGECVNSFGANVCQWLAQCGGGGTPPGPTCADCATWASDPGYQSAFTLVGPQYAPLTCGDLQALTIPLPATLPGDPLYPGEIGKWCGYSSALNNKCGLGFAGCPGLACGDCEALSADPEFATAYVAGLAAYDNKTCVQLDAMNVPQPPFANDVDVQTGRWCAWQAAGASSGCGLGSPSGQCPGLDLCAQDPALCPGPPGCAACDAQANDPGYQFSYWLVQSNYLSMSCQDLQAANVPPPLGAPGDPGYPGELGKWCGYLAALGLQCASAGGGQGCVDGCGDCLVLASHPDFSAAFQGAQAAYTGMSCATLGAQNVPLPPYTQAVETQTGRWCAWQNAGAAAGCGSSSSAGQCPGMDLCALHPGLCPPASPTCGDCKSHLFDPTYQAAWGAELQSRASSTCQGLLASPAASPTTGPPNPVYPGQLGTWCGYQAAVAAKCGSGGCPDPCSDCVTLAADPDFGTAYQGAQTAYAGMDCATLAQQNVPSPPYSVGEDVQSGRWCGFQEAGATAGCTSSSPAGQCPALSMCVVAPAICP